ncbi:hypothetical protein FGY92_09950 [Staphylococcus hominis]|uniref:Pycsar system effector family protein n=1 Tax=Staphylococcus hominis TaxID=1290 RepID=UPI001F2619A8|nr:Pycsar system effector family protein [Staphylococcus hominis]UJB23915.1 hypothetical protein FGY92_09950 [Staphylococcus hominis]
MSNENSKVENKEKIDEIKKLLDDTSNWLKFIEAKIVFLVGLMITVGLKVFSLNKISFTNLNTYLLLLYCIVVIVLILNISSIINIFRKSNDNYLYYKDISAFSVEDFQKKLFSVESWEEYYIRQIHVLSQITTRKHKILAGSTIIFIVLMILKGILEII